MTTLSRSTEQYSTQDLINLKLDIEAELEKRKQVVQKKKLINEMYVTLILSNIPRGMKTMDVSELMHEYGKVRKFEWKKDEEGYELNTMYVTFPFNDAKAIYEKGLYKHNNLHKTITVDQMPL